MSEPAPEATVMLTPATSQDLSFTDKIQSVDTALTDRAAASKKIKTTWANVMTIMAKYNMSRPNRRYEVERAAYLVSDLEILEPRDPRLDDKVNIELMKNYTLRRAAEQPQDTKFIDAHLPGFATLIETVTELVELSNISREVDQVATKTARDELQAAVTAYIAAVEAFDDTVTKMADVKEYISIVKEVAEISAISRGRV